MCRTSADAERVFMSDRTVVNMNQNFFELFGLPQDYNLSLSVLESAYLKFQQTIHPDRFANDDKEQLLAIKSTVFVNEAYETLKSPLKRAQYLLTLKGENTDFDSTTIADRDFLMEQMMLRETLSEFTTSELPEKELNSLLKQVNKKISLLQATFIPLVNSQDKNDVERAVVVVQKMHFLHKFQKEVLEVQDRLMGF